MKKAALASGSEDTPRCIAILTQEYDTPLVVFCQIPPPSKGGGGNKWQ
jgi:hypothetical protein